MHRISVLFYNSVWKQMCHSSSKLIGHSNTSNQARTIRNFPHRAGYVHSISTMPEVLSGKTLGKLADQYDTFILDLDGTLWEVDHVTALPGIGKAMDSLRKLNKKLLFVTNNSLHANELFMEKFNSFGFDAAEDDIFGVAYAAAVYLKDIVREKGSVYVVGSNGMAHELDKAGINHFGVGPDTDVASWNPDDLKSMHFRDDVGTVLVGYDKHFHYNKIFKAASYLLNKDCQYIATNDVEIAFQLSKNRVQPVTGTFVKAISTAARRKPKVIGKPHSILYDCVLQKHPLTDKARTVVIGDSLKADIAFANNVGIDSILVQTGVNSVKDIVDYPGVIPTYVLDSFSRFGSL